MISDADSTQNSGPKTIDQLLGDPDTAAQIEQLVQQLPEINATLTVLREFMASSSRFAENANGIISTARASRPDGEGLVDRLEELQHAAATGSRVLSEIDGPLQDAEVLASLSQLLEMLPRLVTLMSMVEQFLESSSRFAENLNDIVATARSAAENSWPDILDRQNLLDLPGEILGVVESPSLRRLLTSKVLSDDALDVMDQLADSVIEAHANAIDKDERMGRLAAFRALGEPDVQRGVAVTIEIARALGRRMDAERRSAGA